MPARAADGGDERNARERGDHSGRDVVTSPDNDGGRHALLRGPGRHSSGDNVYSCFAGPDNFVVEYTTALEQITDEDAWVPRIWPTTQDCADPRGTAGAGEDLFALWHRTPPEPGLWTAETI